MAVRASREGGREKWQEWEEPGACMEARSVGLSTEQCSEIPKSMLEGVWLGSPGVWQEERMCRLENG